MKNVALNTFLEDLKKNPLFDKEFVDILTVSHSQAEEGEKIAEKIISIVNKRYVEDQKNKT